MELTVTVHRERDGFWSEVAELPGCFASGATLDELREALAEAVGLYVADAPAAHVDQPLGVGERRVTVAMPSQDR